MKTRDSLVVFVSFVAVVYLAQCDASSILDDRDKETEELEELVRNEVVTSLQFLDENENDFESKPFNVDRSKPPYTNSINRNGLRGSNRYYVSNQGPNNRVKTSSSSYKTPGYPSYYNEVSNNPTQNTLQYNKPNGNSVSSFDYEYKPNQAVGFDGTSSPRSVDGLVSSPSSVINTREPEYSASITLPSFRGSRMYSGSYGAGAGAGGGSGGSGYRWSTGGGYGAGGGGGSGGAGYRWSPGGLIGRGLRRLGRLGGRFGAGRGMGYAAGGGLAGLLGGAGLQGLNLGYSGGASEDGYYGSEQGGGLNLSGGQGYYGNGRYGLQGNYDASNGLGGSWNSGNGGQLSDYYNLRYGSQGDSDSTYTLDGSGSSGSRRYTPSYTNNGVSSAVSASDDGNPIQYELMFLRNQPNGENRQNQAQRVQGQNTLSQDTDILQTTGTSGANRDTSNGTGYRVNLSGTGMSGGSGYRKSDSSSNNSNGVEEYRVVVVNKDSPTSGSGRAGVSVTGSGAPAGGSSSWSVSSGGSAGTGMNGGRQGGSWISLSGDGSTGVTSESNPSRKGFQITTPITSTQVNIPPTSIVGSVLSSVQNAATGDQTRSLSAGNDSSGGKIIQVIPVKSNK